MLPQGVLTSTTATGDTVTGPGAPTIIYNGMPASVVGDLVAGAACTGAIAASTSMLLLMGRPAATLTSTVSGVNPVTGIPVATAVAVTTAVTNLD